MKFPDRPDSFTVVDDQGLPIAPAHEYLRFLRDSDQSPHTVRAYARALSYWWTVLEHAGDLWDDFPVSRFGDFLTYLRYRTLPGMIGVSPRRRWLAESSVSTSGAAVLAMYRFHADAHHVTGPHDRLYRARRTQYRAGPYTGFLDGIGPHRDKPIPLYKSRPARKVDTPVLEPGQVITILDDCSVQTEAGWTGGATGLRDRLLLAVLAETGMRLGEAMSLRHNDVHLSGGGTPHIDIAGRDDHPHGFRAKSGPRRIFIGDDLAALYSEYVWQLVQMCADVLVEDLATHFVFVNLGRGPRFAPMRPESVYRCVRRIRRRCAGRVPADWSPHWLRHTHATALLLNGVPPHAVMRRLGHRDIQTTLSVYGWVTEEAEMRSIAEWRNFAAGWKDLR